MSQSRKRKSYSYSYLVDVRADYAEKLLDPRWAWMHEMLKEHGDELDRKIRTYKETELCTQFQQDAILAYILQQKS